jgi:hypothetical protein
MKFFLKRKRRERRKRRGRSPQDNISEIGSTCWCNDIQELGRLEMKERQKGKKSCCAGVGEEGSDTFP